LIKINAVAPGWQRFLELRRAEEIEGRLEELSLS
jgi:hypothetical protein